MMGAAAPVAHGMRRAIAAPIRWIQGCHNCASTYNNTNSKNKKKNSSSSKNINNSNSRKTFNPLRS